MAKRPPKASAIGVTLPPFETHQLREGLKAFLDEKVTDPVTRKPFKVGDYKFGIYAFFDYDGKPIYVGQTNEKVRTRIRRHLTNQRTDAVAMNVLDPFEVKEIQVWPLPKLQKRKSGDPAAAQILNQLEYAVFQRELRRSRFRAVLNEKEPGRTRKRAVPKLTHRGQIVSGEVVKLRSHPDVRIARRASVLARLAQVISERQVRSGLRKTLLTQARRLAWLAKQRYNARAGLSDEED